MTVTTPLGATRTECLRERSVVRVDRPVRRSGRNPAQVQSRVSAYQRFVGILGTGVGPGSLSC